MKSNYQPISISPSLSKVFERLIRNRVGPYSEDLYHKLVFAYRKGYGCDTSLLTLTEQYYKVREQVMDIPGCPTEKHYS